MSPPQHGSAPHDSLPGTFELRIVPWSDWHVGTGRGRLGAVDASVRRDGDGLPFVPAKSLIGVLRDACETVAAALDRARPAAGPGAAGSAGAGSTGPGAALAASGAAVHASPGSGAPAPGGPGGPGGPEGSGGPGTAPDGPREDPEGGSWRDWVDFLFGTQRQEGWEPAAPASRGGGPAARAAGAGPRPAALRVSPARYGTALRDAVRNRPALVQAMVLHRPGVSLDPVTGTVREDFLRCEERAVRGQVLVARVEVIGAGDRMPAPAELLLRAGARLVEGIGGKRNRGAGRVCVLLPGVPVADLEERALTGRLPDRVPADPHLDRLLADARLLSCPGTPPRTPGPPAPLPPRTLAGRRRTLRLAVVVRTPVAVERQQLGNITRTLDRVPGTLLLPALHPRLHREAGLGLGDLRIGPLVPAVPGRGAATGGDGGYVPALPVPRTWLRADKGRGREVINAALREPAADSRAKPLAGWVVRAGEGRWRPVAVGVEVSTHAVIDDEARRPVESSGGGLFSREGIARGTLLAADVVLPVDAGLDLAPGDELRLGRSSKDDHGLVEVLSVREVPAPPAPAPAGRTGEGLRVLCVTDVLLRGPALAQDPTPGGLARELGRVLGCELEPVPAGGGSRSTSVAAVRREGFARRWGRHHVSKVALAAGSVVTVRVVDGHRIDSERLAAVERDGIGERVTEGFGRILVNPPELLCENPDLPRAGDGQRSGGTAVRADRAPAGAPGTEPAGPSGERPGGCPAPGPARVPAGGPARVPAGPAAEGRPGPVPGRDSGRGWWSPDRAHPLELRAWRRAVERRAAALALDPDERAKVLPVEDLPRSQLGSLVAQLERLGHEGGAGPVRQWFDTTGRIQSRARAWKGALGPARDLLLGDPDLRWRHLRLDGARAGLVLEDGREDLVRAELAHEALTVLVREVLRHVRAGHEDPRPTGSGDAGGPGDGTNGSNGLDDGGRAPARDRKERA